MSTQRRIVNIINFIRAVEPRCTVDLVEPVRRQIELVNCHGLPATWLLQYDALVQGPFVDLLRALGPEHEIGGWFEVVQPLVEKVGLRWRGRYPWEEDRLWLRDLHLFDERYAERYLTAVCPSAACTYDTLPLVEGFLWSGDVRAGLFPMRGERTLRGGRPVVEEASASGLRIRWPLTTSEVLALECDERELTVTMPGDDWDLRIVWDERATVPFRGVDGSAVRCTHNGFDYRVVLERGSAKFTPEQRCLRFRPHDGALRLGLDGGRT